MTDRTNPDRAPTSAATTANHAVGMRAIVRDRYGPPEVLELRKVARPQNAAKAIQYLLDGQVRGKTALAV